MSSDFWKTRLARIGAEFAKCEPVEVTMIREAKPVNDEAHKAALADIIDTITDDAERLGQSQTESPLVNESVSIEKLARQHVRRSRKKEKMIEECPKFGMGDVKFGSICFYAPSLLTLPRVDSSRVWQKLEEMFDAAGGALEVVPTKVRNQLSPLAISFDSRKLRWAGCLFDIALRRLPGMTHTEPTYLHGQEPTRDRPHPGCWSATLKNVMASSVELIDWLVSADASEPIENRTIERLNQIRVDQERRQREHDNRIRIQGEAESAIRSLEAFLHVWSDSVSAVARNSCNSIHAPIHEYEAGWEANIPIPDLVELTDRLCAAGSALRTTGDAEFLDKVVGHSPQFEFARSLVRDAIHSGPSAVRKQLDELFAPDQWKNRPIVRDILTFNLIHPNGVIPKLTSARLDVTNAALPSNISLPESHVEANATAHTTRQPRGGDDSGGGQGEAGDKPAKRKRGRRKGSVASNPKQDQKIVDAWAKGYGQYATQEQLATALGIEKADVVAAIDRHRKRTPKPEIIRDGKRRQGQ